MRTTILGGGIAGLTAAIALRKIGIEPVIFEAAPEIKPVGAGLALGANAIKAFTQLGISKDVIAAGRLLPSFAIYSSKGELISRTDSEKISKQYGLDNFTIARADLHKVLLSKLEEVEIHTGKRAASFTQDQQGITVNFSNGSTYVTDILIAADGIHSPIRKQLLPHSKLRYSGYTCWRAMIDNSGLNITESSETWGPKGRVGLVPLANNKLYWFACINARQNDERMKSFRVKDLLENFKDYHSPIPQVFAGTKDEQLIWGDICDLEPIRQYASGNIVLLGDAAHATTPNLGQGACQAIEDAVILANKLKACKEPSEAFKAFEKSRLERTHFIVSTSWSIGRIAQLESPLLCAIRNYWFKKASAKAIRKSSEKLFNIDLAS